VTVDAVEAVAVSALRLLKAFNPDQPRDDRGRWGNSGESGWVEGDNPARIPAFDTSRLGRCYELAGKYVIDHGGTLVHGQIQGAGLPPLGHAWVKSPDGKSVWEPTSGHTYTSAAFERLYHGKELATYSKVEAAAQMLETKIFGPWDSDAEVKEAPGQVRPDGSVVKVSVPWSFDDHDLLFRVQSDPASPVRPKKVWTPRLVKYSPDQERVPAGGPGGGEFGSGGGGGLKIQDPPAWMEEQKGRWTPNPTDSAAFLRYTIAPGWEKNMNAGLRQGQTNFAEPWKGQMAELDAAISHAPKLEQDTEVYRGLSKMPTGWEVGSTVKDAGFMSTSVDERAAEHYFGKIILDLKAPKGSTAAPLDDRLTMYRETEVLFPRGTSFRINSISTAPARTGEGQDTIIHGEIL
jgi:hypothetical protein